MNSPAPNYKLIRPFYLFKFLGKNQKSFDDSLVIYWIGWDIREINTLTHRHTRHTRSLKHTPLGRPGPWKIVATDKRRRKNKRRRKGNKTIRRFSEANWSELVALLRDGTPQSRGKEELLAPSCRGGGSWRAQPRTQPRKHWGGGGDPTFLPQTGRCRVA
jgi:hypothetical protein